LIDRLVAAGRYANADEVMREALLLVECVEADDGLKLDALRQAAEIARRDLDAGRYRDFSSAEALDERLQLLADTAFGDLVEAES
jgi:Arc/MetJ-type ribon-helix-helix transcriptional regulator